ncbi:hypothetical protein ACQPU1_09320 [Clostridium paraputrificum]|uniref:hypothetical protein n=1 Tax=Clostridium TaxID=1485 RepID=UPI003D326E0E
MKNNYGKLSVGDILSKGFICVKDNLQDILILCAVFMLPVIILSLITVSSFVNIDVASLMRGNIPKFTVSGIAVLGSILNSILSFILSALGSGAVIHLLVEREGGNNVTWREAASFAWEKKVSLILIQLLLGVVIFVLGVLLLILGLMITLLTVGLGVILLIPVILIFIALVTSIQPLYISTLVKKDVEVMEAFSITNGMLKNNFIKLLAVGALAMLISAVISTISFIPFLGSIVISISGFILKSFVNACNNIIVEEGLPEFNLDFLEDGNMLDRDDDNKI